LNRKAISLAVLIVAFALAPAVRAGTVQPQIIGLFPKEIGEFAYADLKSARKFSWYAQLKEQMLPSRFRQFEAFLASAGMDPNRQVDELVWAAVMKDGGEYVLGVALGQFSPETAENFFKQQKLPTKNVRGFTLFAFGSGVGPADIFFFFLDSNTAAFGHADILEKLIEVRMGAEESLLRNEKIYPLIDEANGRGIVWAVLNEGYTRLGIQQLTPEVAQFPDAPKIIAKLKAMIIGIDADRDVTAMFQAVCETPDDANFFSSLMQAGIVYKRQLEGQKNPELAKLLDEMRVEARGDRLEVRMNLTEEMLLGMIRRNTFSVKM
jgi:hypothetical protein